MTKVVKVKIVTLANGSTDEVEVHIPQKVYRLWVEAEPDWKQQVISRAVGQTKNIDHWKG